MDGAALGDDLGSVVDAGGRPGAMPRQPFAIHHAESITIDTRCSRDLVGMPFLERKGLAGEEHDVGLGGSQLFWRDARISGGAGCERVLAAGIREQRTDEGVA